MAMLDALFEDERAIEGLPIRLVIALIVGIASLSLMMGMIDGLGGLGVTELDVRPEPEVIGPGGESIDVTVLGSEGETVESAVVRAKSGTAQLDGIVMERTGENGVATLDVDPTLADNQAEGTITLDVKPPDGSYADRRENQAILVVDT